MSDWARFGQILARSGHAGSVVVRRFATAQNHVAVRVTLGLHNGHLAVLMHGQKVVSAGGCLNRVGGDFDIAIRAVFEADRGRQARGQLAVHLALGGARADGTPGNQVPQILGRNDVQKLAARGQAQAVDVDQQLARNTQALVDAETFVQVGVVDQTFPAHGRTGFFEIHAHHDLQRVRVALALRFEAGRVLQCGVRIVDGAGPNDHQQPVVLAGHDGLNALARLRHQGFDGGALDREKADQMLRGR